MEQSVKTLKVINSNIKDLGIKGLKSYEFQNQEFEKP